MGDGAGGLPTFLGSSRNPPTSLSSSQLTDLLQRLPYHCRLSAAWQLLYCNLQHGISLHTLYRGVEDKHHVILVVTTSRGEIFGAYLPDPIQLHGKHYYGSGRTMLWTLALPPQPSRPPSPAATPSLNSSPADFPPHASLCPSGAPQLRCYSLRESRASPCLLCRSKGVGMGGGDADFCGLWVDASLLCGVTRHCIVFGSHPLLPQSAPGESSVFSPVHFAIYAVEVWHVPVPDAEDTRPSDRSLPQRPVLTDAHRRQFTGRMTVPLASSERWVPLYNSLEDGISLLTLYERARGHRNVVLAVMDADGHVCGFFTPEPLAHGRIDGAAGMALWSFAPVHHPHANHPGNEPLKLRAFVGTLSSAHSHGISCGTAGLGVGADCPEAAALWLDRSLAHGVTSKNTAPFNSIHLIPEHEDAHTTGTATRAFLVADVEVWHVPCAPFIAAAGAAVPHLTGSTRPILREAHLRHLIHIVPQRCRLARQWTLAFSTAVHGITCEGIQELYRSTAALSDLMLVVATTDGHVFGAFAPRLVSVYSPQASLRRRAFAQPDGGDPTVLWTFALPDAPEDGSADPATAEGNATAAEVVGAPLTESLMQHAMTTPLVPAGPPPNRCNAYYWKPDTNDYFVVCQADGFGIGGGGAGDFGIWIDGELLYGTTGRCETFGSPPLIPSGPDDDADSEAHTAHFEIYSLEVWHMPDLV